MVSVLTSTCLFSLVVRARVMIVDHIALSYVERGLDEARSFSECEGAKRNKHALNGATTIPFGGDVV